MSDSTKAIPPGVDSPPSLATLSAAGDSVHDIGLCRYAALMTQLGSGQTRSAVLSSASLSEEQWNEVEKTWGLRLAKAAQAGDTKLLLEFEKAVAKAYRDCPALEPTRSLAEYASMVAAIENGTEPVIVCAKAKLRLNEFFALQQAWTRKVASDPELSESFRLLVDGAKS